jgi:DNA-binding NarL/FixJ family response regulator
VTTRPITVLLADDHALVRSGIRSLLDGVAGIEVVGEAGDGHDALRLAAALRPDVLLLDIKLPSLNGLEVADRLAREQPGVKVVMLSMHDNEEYVLHALRAGAAGYLLKDATVPELEMAIRSVARGETYLSPPVSKHLVGEYLRRATGDGVPELLTPRQREVLQLVAEGHSTKEIAARLTLSVKTVETHRAQLMERLDIHDVAGLVRYALRVGLVGGGD